MIALDWGLSSFRAFRLDAAGAILAQRSAPAGVLTIADGGFEAALAGQLGDWLDGGTDSGPIVAAGMIGSRQGWIEAPYVPCPAGVADLAGRLTRHALARGGAIWFVPGAQWSDDSAIDVMRGEETQIVGALAARAIGDAVLCLPGTHSKWAIAAGGRITRFRTYMTGELFAVLRRHSLLGRLMPEHPADDRDDEAAFAQGLARAAEPGGLSHHLFSARTAGLFGRIAGPALASYLSGLVIGDEIASALATAPRDVPLLLVGAPALCARYEAALAQRGIAADVLPETVGALGIHTIARAAGLADGQTMIQATIRIEDPDQPALRALLAEADAFYGALYPPEHNHLLDVASLQAPGVAFHVARIDGRIVGFGALIAQEDGWAEIKRMYVDPASRGQGLGRLILEALEHHARRIGVRRLRLETGTRQPAALSLYRAAGFQPRGPFGRYTANTSSLFFEKALG